MNYASWGARVGASILDGLVIVPFAILAAVFGGPGVDPDTGQATGPGPLYWVFVLLALALNGYNRWYLAGKTGQSWGKKALGIQLVGEASGQPIGVGMAFLRELAHFVDGIICYIGYLWPLWDAKKQTLGDKIVKTLVVR
ncbi:RDD family protein [Plantactinospora sp. WMMB782]|uniref:RDD family protein n=1 Tax=Plantactinospora sp. WMMB782 TaxID=3404121 RepID=UPI003B95AF6A